MADYLPCDPKYRERIEIVWKGQRAMHFIGAELSELSHGFAEVTLPCSDDLTQHNGYVHAGMISAIADTAGGAACMTLLPPEANVLAVEFKVNFLEPAKGDYLAARANVIKSGRNITVCRIDIFAITGDAEILCAAMQQTLLRIDRPLPRPAAD